ncbi:FadR/GntR family transcriptional regulator [Bengtsoniella intestinalis]|uniref:FadR/GntR family transcriptional regulator n=1 Tax=Bengtsoniella intestinalis TaxID=3073143 RepID=UPI00391F581B
MTMEPIPGGTVVDKIIHKIRDAIGRGRFAMGDKLPTEFELMEELHVSRNSLREAMKILTAMGIVEIKRGDGTYICSEIRPNIMDFMVYSMLLEDSNPEEIIELRQTLDEDVLEMAVLRATDQDIQALEEIMAQMRTCFTTGDLRGASKVDYQFHMCLATASHNKFLSRIVTGVYGLFEGSIENNICSEAQFAKADHHHQEMLDCLKDRDCTRVRQVVADSLSIWKANVEKSQHTAPISFG